MSLKRSKQMSYGRAGRDDIEDSPRPNQPSDPEKTWSELVEGHAPEEFAPYSLSGHFRKGSLIAHATFGRGAVVSAVDRRIEVVFEGGKKTLSHAG
jgi:hypothetical protein